MSKAKYFMGNPSLKNRQILMEIVTNLRLRLKLLKQDERQVIKDVAYYGSLLS